MPLQIHILLSAPKLADDFWHTKLYLYCFLQLYQLTIVIYLFPLFYFLNNDTINNLTWVLHNKFEEHRFYSFNTCNLDTGKALFIFFFQEKNVLDAYVPSIKS